MAMNEDQLKAQVESMRAELDALPHPEVPTKIKQIDWGSRQRGQGRRSGGMIKGGMSSAPTGIKTYHIPDLSKYGQDAEEGDFRCLEFHTQISDYIKGRNAKLSHWQSMYYALT